MLITLHVITISGGNINLEVYSGASGFSSGAGTQRLQSGVITAPASASVVLDGPLTDVDWLAKWSGTYTNMRVIAAVGIIPR